MRLLIIVVIVIFQILSSCNSSTQTSAYLQELIVCGWDEVYILDMNKQEIGEPQKIWTWRGTDRSDLPESFRSLFNSTDECKPFDQGNKILTTSSGGGVAYVDRKQDQILFYGRAANAHSADLLPNDRIAVAASHDPNGHGDRLIIFDIKQSNKELWTEELPWGHGVVWDQKRSLLWTLSGHDIRVFKLKDWQTNVPKLEKVNTIILPERGGHDLYPIPDTPYLIITTATKCWQFDRDKNEIKPHPQIPDAARIKSISQHPLTGQIVYVQAEGDNWWAENLHFINPEHTYFRKGEHFYKARWNTRVE